MNLFSLDNIYIEQKLSVEFIYQNLSDEQLFHYYIKNFKRISEVFCSELRKDKKASCSIYQNSSGLRYKDFSTGENLNIFDYLQVKYGCNFYESLRIITTDFNLLKVKIDINPRLLVNIPEKPFEKVKTEITCVHQPFTLKDYEYWNKYHIPLDLLEKYEIKSAKKVFLKKENRFSIFSYSNTNPIYSYRFEEDKREYYKIYFPLADKSQIKWITNVKSDIIQGESQLPEKDELLIITKALKDVLCYRLMDYNAIAPQSEGTIIKKAKIDELKGRFKRIITNFDEDTAGINGAERLNKDLGLKSFVLTNDYGCKDLSDIIKEKGLKIAKNIVEKELKNL